MSKRAMDNERRSGMKPTTSQLFEMLNAEQRKMLPAIKSLGWELCFSRNRLFLDPIIVICNRRENMIGILEHDGSINIEADVKMRNGDDLIKPDDPDKPITWTY